MTNETNNKHFNQTPRRSFFKAVANRLKATRLGDLLVDSGLISSDQLTDALTAQRTQKKPLGQVLISLGVISPTTLYRKLAEQWVMKIAAAGFTMIISTTTIAPRTASAEVVSKSARSAFSEALQTKNYKLDNVAYPAMFGTQETRSNDISGFNNWTGMLARFESGLDRGEGLNQMSALQSRLRHLQGQSLNAKIAGVNAMMNTKPYIEDSRNYGKSDYWATPVEFMQRGGDCEDYAIAKYVALRALDVPASQMRIAVVMDKTINQHHAVLVVYDNDGEAYVLDNQVKTVRPLESVKRYKPIFSINQQSWWLHKNA